MTEVKCELTFSFGNYQYVLGAKVTKLAKLSSDIKNHQFEIYYFYVNI